MLKFYKVVCVVGVVVFFIIGCKEVECVVIEVNLCVVGYDGWVGFVLCLEGLYSIYLVVSFKVGE